MSETGGHSVNITAIAVGITVPAVIIALVIGAYFWYRKQWDFGPAAAGPMPTEPAINRNANEKGGMAASKIQKDILDESEPCE